MSAIPSRVPDKKIQQSAQSTVTAQQKKRSVINRLREGTVKSGTQIRPPEPKSSSKGKSVDFLA